MKSRVRPGVGLRSVVQSAILAERPATLTIIMIAMPIGYTDLFKQAHRICTGPSVRMDNEAEPTRQRSKRVRASVEER